MTLVPTSVTSAELVSIAGTANQGHKLCMQAAVDTVAFAIEVGHALLKAYELVPDGEWRRWIENNCDFDFGMASKYQRLAHYSHELTGDETSVNQAAIHLQGLAPLRVTGGRPSIHSDDLMAKARALRSKGQSARQVAEQLGVSMWTIYNWSKPIEEQRAYETERARRLRAARKALKEQEQREAVMAAAGPSVAELYSRVRLALEVVDAAILEPTDNDQGSAGLLRQTRSFLYSAESPIVKALGVE